MLVILSMLVESDASESIKKHGDYTKRVKEMQSKLKELKSGIVMQTKIEKEVFLMQMGVDISKMKAEGEIYE